MSKRFTQPKLTPPETKGAIPRERLFGLLDDQRCAMWIHGPPGSGKTTLAATYLQRRGLQPLWYQVDADDREPSTFFHFLSEAISMAATPRQKPQVRVGTEVGARLDWIRVARGIARTVLASLPSDTALVFDNVHEGGDPIAEILATFVAEMAGRERLVLISYHPPARPFAEALSRQQIAIVPPDKLRFDSDETARLVRTKGLTDPDQIARLDKLANGWVAAIVLLALHPAAADANLPGLADGASILDYTSRQLIDWMPEELAQVLESCVFFPDFDISLACSASNNPRAGEWIAKLHREGFFVERHDSSKSEAYSMHSLLVEALKRRLGPRGSASRRLAEAVAGKLLVREGHHEAGVALLLGAESFRDAAACIRGVARQMIASGRAEQLANWVSLIPQELRVEDPWLEFWDGMAAASVDAFEARRVFRPVYQRFRESGERLGMVLSASAVLGALDISWRSYGEVDFWIKARDDAWSPDIVFPNPEAELLASIGHFTMTGDGNLARRFADRLPALIETSDDVNLVLRAATGCIAYLTSAREFERGLLLINLVEQSVDLSAASPPRAAMWSSFAARTLAVAGLALGRAVLRSHSDRLRERASSLVRNHGVSCIQVLHMEVDALVRAGDISGAKAALDDIETVISPGMPLHSAWHWARRCRVELHEGRPRDALRSISTACDFMTEAQAPAQYSVAFLQLRAACLAWLGSFDEAATQVEAARRAEFDVGASMVEVCGALCEALRALATPGASPAPIRDFFVALRDLNAYDHGLVGLPLVAPVCLQALREGVELSTATELVLRRKIQPPSGAGKEWPWPVKLFALGPFSIHLYGRPLTFEGKSQKRPIELLKFLVARSDPLHQGKGVRVDQVVKELWADADAKTPKGSFDVTVHRLRKLLEREDSIVVAEGRIQLNDRVVWCDVHAFEANASRAMAGEPGFADKALALYDGPLFNLEEEVRWSAPKAKRLAECFTSLVNRRGAALEEQGAFHEALNVYEQGLLRDNLVESFYRGLMRCHLALMEGSAALQAYRRCRELLSIVLGVLPSPETEDLWRRVYEANTARK